MNTVRRFLPLLKTLAGAAILAVLIWRLGTGAVIDALHAISAGEVLAALVIGVLTTVVSAWRWCLVARRLGLELPLARAVADCYQALFLNSVLPAGVLGDVQRAVSHGRESGDVGRGVRAVVLERTAGHVVFMVVGVVVLLAQPDLLFVVATDLVPGIGGAVGVLVAVVIAAVLGAWMLRSWIRGNRVLGNRVLGNRVLSRERLDRIRGALRTGVTEARVGLLSRDMWPALVLLSVAAVVGYLALFVVAARAAGSDASVLTLLPLLMLALLVMGLPINIGGWGPREAVLAVAFGAVGMGAAQGLTAAVVYGVLSMIACLPGAAVLVLRRVTGSRRTRRPGSTAVPVPSPRTPVTADRSHPTPCMRPCPASAGGDGRRPASLLTGSPA